MKQRCYYKKSISYKHYGARGISICGEWRANFSAFHTWANNNGYKPGLSIDRINIEKGYTPENCRWITRADQNKNSRSNIFISKDGKKQVLKDWCRELNLNYGSVLSRIQSGWSHEEALMRGRVGFFHE